MSLSTFTCRKAAHSCKLMTACWIVLIKAVWERFSTDLHWSGNGTNLVSSSCRAACKMVMHMTCSESFLFYFRKGAHNSIGQSMEGLYALPHAAGLHQFLRTSKHGALALFLSVVCSAAHIDGVIGRGVCVLITL